MSVIIQEPTGVVYTCADCGCIVTEHKCCTVDNTVYCSDCFNEKYYLCANCGEAVPIEDKDNYTYFHRDGTETAEYYCETCFSELFMTCDWCGGIVPSENINDTADAEYSHVCDACSDRYFTQCDYCGDYRRNDDTVEDTSNGCLCESCYENDFYTCADCGRFVEAGVAIPINDDHYCERCADDQEEEEEENGLVRNYHCNPPLNYYTTLADNTDATRYYGIELEIDHDKRSYTIKDSRENCAKQLLNIMNPDSYEQHFFAMHDGSLSCDGLELISHPITRNYFNDNLTTSTEKMFKQALNLGYRGNNTSTCGLHFHVSRHSLTDDTIHNMILCMSQFWPTILTLSRRTEDSLHRWAKRYMIGDCETPADKKILAINYATHGDRYYCLNNTNTHTVELRIFRSTLKYSTFMACWDFFKFLIEWCESHTIEEIAVTTTEQFIELMSNYTPTLKNYLTERGLI